MTGPGADAHADEEATVDAESENTAQADHAPSDAPSGDDGVLLELSSDPDPDSVNDDPVPHASGVTLQVSGPAVDVEAEDAEVDPTDTPPYSPCLALVTAATSPIPEISERATWWLLREGPFRYPIRSERWFYLQKRGIEKDEIYAVAHGVVRGRLWTWGRRSRRRHYGSFVDELRDALNDEICDDLLGYDWEREVGKWQGKPATSLDAPARGASDGDVRTLRDQLKDWSRLEDRAAADVDVDRVRTDLGDEERRVLDAVLDSVCDQGLRKKRGADRPAPNLADAYSRIEDNVDYSEDTFRRRWRDLVGRIRRAG